MSSAGSLDRSRRHFTDSDVPFLGTHGDRAQRIGVEHVLALHNALVYSNLRLEIDLDDLLTKISYDGDGGVRQHLAKFNRFHPVRDVKANRQWLGYYRWYERICSNFLIYITKEQYASHKVARATSIAPAFFQQLPHPSKITMVAGPIRIIDSVVGLAGPGDQVIVYCLLLVASITQSGQAQWQVTVQGSEAVQPLAFNSAR